MRIIKIIFLSIVSLAIVSCKKNKDLNEIKCFCIEYKYQKCLKYYQTAEQDPWGTSLLSNTDLKKEIQQFCDSLNVQVFKITIKETKDKSELFMPCTCSRTGKIICIKVNENDTEILKKYKFIDN